MEHAAIHGLIVPNMQNCWPAKENEIATCCYGKGFASSCNCLLTKDGHKARLHSHFNGLARMQGPPRTKQENKIATRNPIFCSGVLCNRGALKCVHCLAKRDPNSFDSHMPLILISRILDESRLFFPSRAAVFIYKRLACHED